MKPASDAAPAASREPALRKWFECDNQAAAAAVATAAAVPDGNGGLIYNGDETSSLPALPVPCKGAGNPRMAILDVAIIRTEDNATSNLGINLLSGLTYVLNNTFQVTDVLTAATGTTPSRTVTITRQRSQGFPAAGISYSLNIANATDSRSEVLARPSLVGLDRKASTFFSGETVTLGIAGQAGGPVRSPTGPWG